MDHLGLATAYLSLRSLGERWPEEGTSPAPPASPAVAAPTRSRAYTRIDEVNVAAILHVLEGPDTGRLFALSSDQATIGRNAENTIVLNDASVSGVHVRLTRNEQGRFTIQDVSSTNGTFVNGRETRASDLRHGDVIRIGATALSFELRQRSRRIKGSAPGLGSVEVQGTVAPTLITVDIASLSRDELEREYRRSLILNQLDEQLTSAEGSSEMLGAVLDAAMQSSGAQHGLILLLDRKSGEMIPSVARSRREGLRDVGFSKILAFDVASSGEGYVGDPPQERGAPVVVAPFSTTSDTSGVIYLSGPVDGFGTGELRAVEAISRRAGVSLSAARWRVDFEILFGSMFDAIMKTVQAKDVYTRGHSERVRHYSKLLGKELGLGKEELYRLTLGAALHDIGKLGMPDSVLKHNKSPRLTEEQMLEVRKHPQRGAEILRDIPFLADVVPAAELHHEDWDGSGYPHGLAGEDIPLIARIVAVADTYDAITTDRPYQKGKSYEEGHEILRKIAGKRLEPALVEAFISAWYKYRKGPSRKRYVKTTRVDAAATPRAAAAHPGPPEPGPTRSEPVIDDGLSQIIEIG
ncbi:MAG: FHA domain-containing protein [Planctomycetota bacterium]|nr:MAG: FHA domain-containing protein [Planctomycetota bacterium]